MVQHENMAGFVLQMIEQLEPDMQDAVYWKANNLKLVDEIVGEEKISIEKLEEYIRRAKQENDCFLLVMALYKQIKDQ